MKDGVQLMRNVGMAVYVRVNSLSTSLTEGDLEYSIQDGRLVMKNTGVLYSNVMVPGNIRIVFDTWVYDTNEVDYLNAKNEKLINTKQIINRYEQNKNQPSERSEKYYVLNENDTKTEIEI